MEKDLSTETVVVLGAKPNAPLPALPVKNVITANGAVEVALEYRKKYGSNIIGLVPIIELRKHEHIQESFKKGQPDEIIILGEDGGDTISYVRNDLGLKDSKITILNFHEVNWNMAKPFAGGRLSIALKNIRSRGIKDFITHVIPDLLTKRDMVWMHRSTGFGAILYALKRFPNAEKIITAGISLQAGGHFNNVGTFTQKTASADQIVVKHWSFENRKNVFTTDDVMHEEAHFPKWEGETFVWNNQ